MIRQMSTMIALLGLAAMVPGPSHAQDANRTARTPSGSTLTGLAAEPNPPAQYSTQELEDVRTQLLNLEGALEQLAGAAPPNSVDLASLQQAKAGIQQMPYEHLNALRKGISPSGISTRLAQSRQHMQSFLAARAAGNTGGSSRPLAQIVPATPATPFPAPTSICSPQGLISAVTSFAEGGEQLLFGSAGGTFSVTGSIGVGGCLAGICGSTGVSITLSTGTSSPTSTSMGASVAPGSAGSYDPQALPNMRIPEDVVLGADAVWFLADAIREFSQDACNEQILGENAKLACIAVDALWVVAKAVDGGIHYCDSDLTTQVTDSSYSGLSYIYSNLYSIGNALDTHIGTADTEIDTRLGNANTEINTRLGNADTDIDTRIAALTAQLALLNSQTSTQFAALNQLVGNLVLCLKSPATCGSGGGAPAPGPLSTGRR